MTSSLVLLQKLCKNCPHPEKLHFNLAGNLPSGCSYLITSVLDSWKDFQRKIKRQEEKDWTIHVWENFKSKVGTLCYQNLRSTKVHHSMPTHNEMIYFLKMKLGKQISPQRLFNADSYTWALIFPALSSHRINFSSSKSMTPLPTSDIKPDMETIKSKQFLSACIVKHEVIFWHPFSHLICNQPLFLKSGSANSFLQPEKRWVYTWTTAVVHGL